MAVHTSGNWQVKPGREQDFVKAWQGLAEWSVAQFDPGWGKLLQDREDPAHFISLGEWKNEQVLEEWRASDGFKQHLDRIRELVEDMGIRTYDLLVEVGQAPTR